MQYNHAQHEQWLRWFMDRGTTDEDALKKALRSVPEDPDIWHPVQTRLRHALRQAKDEILPSLTIRLSNNYRTYTESDRERWDLVTLKERLFLDEIIRRSRAYVAASNERVRQQQVRSATV